MEIKAVRGTRDILAEENIKWYYIEKIARELFPLYGYNEIKTPIFERTELFVRGIGEGTDIVDKEMYTFLDKKDRSITLRPEGTAGIIRAYLEHKMYVLPGVTKLFYIGPMFRYERPQAGRYRQHTQIGAEALGSMNPYLDAEIISMLVHIFKSIGLKNLNVQLNSVGCKECRSEYKKNLQNFLEKKVKELCEDCQDRLFRNPLRVLDCKNPSCKEILSSVPDIIEFLCNECRSHFTQVKKYFDSVEIEYVHNKYLVRGLDYYTRTVFEIAYENLGAQNAVAAGGRYDNLIQELGGPSIPGIGFAMGLDRLVLAIQDQKVNIPFKNEVDVFVSVVGEEASFQSFTIIHSLRNKGIHVESLYEDKSLKNQISYASKIKSKFLVIIGDNEISRGIVMLKDMETTEQTEVNLYEIVGLIQDKLQKKK
ncbi:MAG: histidine--tRNA ligase [Candidatus Firestonebacteria bacterium]|nr:histidine--tRNA ligase [Candidatus Firestonebacteria bacterium]